MRWASTGPTPGNVSRTVTSAVFTLTLPAIPESLDGGWTGDHYCRSWELMGLHKFGPIINVDKTEAPYANTRRLITDFDVGGDASRAHSSVQPGSRAKQDKSGKYLHEDVWRYMFTHPVDVVGRATEMDEGCEKDQKG